MIEEPIMATPCEPQDMSMEQQIQMHQSIRWQQERQIVKQFLSKIEEDIENEDSRVFSSCESNRTEDQYNQAPCLERVE